MKGAKRIELDFQAAMKWQELLVAAGFVDVHFMWLNLPIGPWAKGRKNKIIGQLNLINLCDAIEGTAKLLQLGLGWEDEKVHAIISEVKKEM
jgi:hypothetical protein